uniref:Response regulatory domain-containing protein n=1 Tax=Arcella intermedia TaxID=1963864 RepID=A0A6B2LSD9_9EUKA
MFVDDTEMNRKLGHLLLKNYFSEIDFAEDGQDALKKVAAKQYGIIFMDCMMPLMNGIDATKKIRELEHFKEVPIIGVTAVASTLGNKCLEAGMNDVLEKPVTLNDFKGVLSKFGFFK